MARKPTASTARTQPKTSCLSIVTSVFPSARECGPIAAIPSLHHRIVNDGAILDRDSIGTWFIRTWLSRTQAASNARWSRGRVVSAAFAPMGGVELRRYRAAVDLARAVERQRGDNVDKTGMRIGRPLVETIGLEILRRDRRKIGRAHV